MRLHPAFEDDDRRERVQPRLARTLPDRHARQPIARFETRQPLVEHFDVDRQHLAQLFSKLARASSRGPLAAIHVERQSDDDRAHVSIPQQRAYCVEIMLERPPLDDTQRMHPHRRRISNSDADSAAAEIKRGYRHQAVGSSATPRAHGLSHRAASKVASFRRYRRARWTRWASVTSLVVATMGKDPARVSSRTNRCPRIRTIASSAAIASSKRAPNAGLRLTLRKPISLTGLVANDFARPSHALALTWLSCDCHPHAMRKFTSSRCLTVVRRAEG